MARTSGLSNAQHSPVSSRKTTRSRHDDGH